MMNETPDTTNIEADLLNTLGNELANNPAWAFSGFELLSWRVDGPTLRLCIERGDGQRATVTFQVNVEVPL